MATPIPRNEATFTVETILEATGGVLRAGEETVEVSGVVTDSRAVAKGCLFVALRGAIHDAHGFVDRAAEAGAGAVLVSRQVEGLPPHVAVIEVPDTLVALGDLAAHHRDRWEGTLVGITGSAGKTGTKELTAAALQGCGRRVLRTAGNLNNLVGVPMTLFGLDETVDTAVIEMGTNRPGEIGRLAGIARPDVGLVTLVAAAHTEGLGDVEAVAEEKSALLLALHPRGVAIMNGDDGTLRAWGEKARAARRIFFGRDEGADVQLLRAELTGELRTRCTWHVADVGDVSTELTLVGEAAARNAAAALAVVTALGDDPVKALAAMAAVPPTAGRMCPVALGGDLLVLDDTYNANPRSTALAVDTIVAARAARGRGSTFAVLGDMRELGDRAESDHAAVGRHVARAGVNVFVAVGHDMAFAARAAREAADLAVHHVTDAAEALDLVARKVSAGDLVLVKGSRSMEMERVVEGLRHPEGEA